MYLPKRWEFKLTVYHYRNYRIKLIIIDYMKNKNKKNTIYQS